MGWDREMWDSFCAWGASGQRWEWFEEQPDQVSFCDFIVWC